MIEYITNEMVEDARRNIPVVFGPIGEDIYFRTYSRTKRDGSQEDWYETCARIVNGNLNYVSKVFIEKDEALKLFHLLVKMEILPAGRHLWATGIGRDFINNCLAGETLVPTTQGIFPIKELVGQTVGLYAEDQVIKPSKTNSRQFIGKREVTGICKSYGPQKLYQMVLSDGQTIYTTAQHLWHIIERKVPVTTEELMQIKHKSIPYVLSPKKPIVDEIEYKLGLCAGYVFGDGTRNGETGASVCIYGAARKDVAPYFREIKTCSLAPGGGRRVIEKECSVVEHDDYTYIGRLPAEFKDLPLGRSKDYVVGWFRGFFAADGCVSKNGTVLLCNKSRETLLEIQKLLTEIGLVCFPPRIMRTKNPFDSSREAYMYQMTLLQQSCHVDDFLLTHHRANFSKKSLNPYKAVDIVSITETDRIEEVFCFEVPDGHKFAIGNWILTSNCFSSDFSPRFSEHFEFSFMRLMEGGGVGANYSTLFVNSREGTKPWIPKAQVNVHIICHPSHNDYNKSTQLDVSDSVWCRVVEPKLCDLLSEQYDCDWDPGISNGEGPLYLRVEDSREGWAEALTLLLDAIMDERNHDRDIVYDISNVRPYGAILKGFGGKASGPDALALLLKRTNHLLSSKYGSPLVGMDYMLIDHYIAQSVVSGGSRRSARMSLKYWKDVDIFDFIECKAPSDRGGITHWTTNISCVIDKKFISALKKRDSHAVAVYDAIIKGMVTNGEPGIINASKCLEGEAPGTEFYSVNPCAEIAMVRYPDLLCNDVCCLGHINLDRVQAPQEAFRLVTRFLIRATFAKVADEKQLANVMRNRRIGVGFLGYHNWLVKNKIKYSEAPSNEKVRKFFQDMYTAIDNEVRKYCSQLRIPECIKKTTIAPTGTVGNVAGCSTGCQSVFSKAYIRRVRLANTDDLLVKKKNQGYEIVPDLYAANTSVVQYICIDPIFEQAVEMLTKEYVEQGHSMAKARGLAQLEAADLVEDQDELTVDDVLSTQRMLQKEFVDNSISITVNVNKDKYSMEELSRVIQHYLSDLKGLTIFPEVSMPLAPLERITVDQLNTYEIDGYPVERSQAEMSCGLLGCPIK